MSEQSDPESVLPVDPHNQRGPTIYYRNDKCERCETENRMTALVYVLCFMFGVFGYFVGMFLQLLVSGVI